MGAAPSPWATSPSLNPASTTSKSFRGFPALGLVLNANLGSNGLYLLVESILAFPGGDVFLTVLECARVPERFLGGCGGRPEGDPPEPPS